MTRKDYILIADTIKSMPVSNQARKRVTDHFARQLAAANSNFNEGMFRNYIAKEPPAKPAFSRGDYIQKHAEA